TVQEVPEVAGGAPGGPTQGGLWNGVQRAALLFARQRAATVLVIVVLLVVYFGFFSSASSEFLTKDNIANITWTLAPWAIIAIGEGLLLVCGELDLSVGFILGSPGSSSATPSTSSALHPVPAARHCRSSGGAPALAN